MKLQCSDAKVRPNSSPAFESQKHFIGIRRSHFVTVPGYEWGANFGNC